MPRGAHGLFAECGLRSWGGDAVSKHSPMDRLELGRVKPGLTPNRKEGSWFSPWIRPGTALVLLPLVRDNDGRRSEAILRL